MPATKMHFALYQIMLPKHVSKPKIVPVSPFAPNVLRVKNLKHKDSNQLVKKKTVSTTLFVVILQQHASTLKCHHQINPLKPELNPICYLLALLGAHHFLHVSRIRVKLLTLR